MTGWRSRWRWLVPALAAALALAARAEPQLIIEELAPGVGRAAAPGMELVVHYTGWLFDPTAPGQRGRQFDSSRQRGQPLGFVLGAGRVIPGWEQGCAGLRVGGRRRLIIPAELGYGSRGTGDGVIPPGATLLFEVELLAIGVEDSPPPPAPPPVSSAD